MTTEVLALTTLARQIHNLRRARGWSQPELATKVESSTTMIGRYERAEMMPAVDTVAKLADVFGVTMDHLYHGEGVVDAVRDKAMAERLKVFASLLPNDQAHILATFDALTRDAQTRRNYGGGENK
jgi:transcriptional regulator with XRE-family HTH domain